MDSVFSFILELLDVFSQVELMDLFWNLYSGNKMAGVSHGSD